MRAVNLLPKDEVRARRGLPRLGPWIVVSAAAPVLAASFVYLGFSIEHSSVTAKRAELRTVHERIRALNGSSDASAIGEAALVGERSLRQAALVDVLAKGVSWDVMLDDLGRVIPPDVWLTTLTAQSPTPSGVAVATTAVGPNPTGFTLAGFAHSQEAVAHLLARLQLLPMLSDVTLGSTTASDPGTGQPVVQFQLTAIVQPTTKAPIP